MRGFESLRAPHMFNLFDMKKIIALVFCAVSLIGAIGCQKNEIKEEDQIKLDDRLVGTKWQTSDFAYKLIYGGNPYEVYEFISTTEVENYTISSGNVVKSYGTYTYQLNYPHITIDVVSSGVATPTHYTFKDSRTMVRDDLSESSPYAKYLKQ